MIFNFKINFWDIDGYINLDKKYRSKLRRLVKEKYRSYVQCSKNLNTTSMALSDFLRGKSEFISITHFCDLLDILGIQWEEAEPQVIAFKDSNSTQSIKISFPIIYSPLHLRVISCVMGDGSLHKENLAVRWIQKDTTPMIKLINNLVGIRVKSHTNNMQITVPAFFRRIACFALDLKPKDLASTKIIQQVLKLPKEYRLEFLLGVLEDEATIDWKHHGGVDFRMSDKEVIFYLKKLADSLEYNTTEIRKIDNRGSFKRGTLFRFKILSNGIQRLNKDIISLVEEYGSLAGLWKKQEQLDLRVKKLSKQL